MRVGANTANDAQEPYWDMCLPMDYCETIGLTMSLFSSLSHLSCYSHTFGSVRHSHTILSQRLIAQQENMHASRALRPL